MLIVAAGHVSGCADDVIRWKATALINFSPSVSDRSQRIIVVDVKIHRMLTAATRHSMTAPEMMENTPHTIVKNDWEDR
jgi:hypothetical protein